MRIQSSGSRSLGFLLQGLRAPGERWNSWVTAGLGLGVVGQSLNGPLPLGALLTGTDRRVEASGHNRPPQNPTQKTQTLYNPNPPANYSSIPLLSPVSANTPIACCHSPAFSQALMLALIENSLRAILACGMPERKGSGLRDYMEGL